MSDFFSVRITFMDDREELVEWVTRTDTADGVLTLRQENRGSYFSDTKHLGSYPIANIRHWKREERR